MDKKFLGPIVGLIVAAVVVGAIVRSGALKGGKSSQPNRVTSVASPFAPGEGVSGMADAAATAAGLTAEQKRDKMSAFNQQLSAERDRLEERLAGLSISEEQKQKQRDELAAKLREQSERYAKELNLS